MEILFMALALLVAGAVNIVCFAAGARIAHVKTKEQPKEIAVEGSNPVAEPAAELAAEPVQEKQHIAQEPEEPDIKRQRMDAILRNIERYDGTADGQESIPE